MPKTLPPRVAGTMQMQLYCDGTQLHRDIALYQKATTTTVAETAGAGPQQERFVSPQTLSGETVIA